MCQSHIIIFSTVIIIIIIIFIIGSFLIMETVWIIIYSRSIYWKGPEVKFR